MSFTRETSQFKPSSAANDASGEAPFGSGEPGDLVGYTEAAAILGVPVGTLYAWVHHRRVPHVRLGPRLVKFSRVGLVRWLAERAVGVEVQS